MDSRTLVWLFFGLSGRVSRMAYFLTGLLLYLIRMYPVYRILRVEQGSTEATFWGGVFLVVIGATLICHIALSVKRLHDMNHTGWFSLLFIIGDVIAFIFLSIAPGTAGPNRFGSRVDTPK